MLYYGQLKEEIFEGKGILLENDTIYVHHPIYRRVESSKMDRLMDKDCLRRKMGTNIGEPLNPELKYLIKDLDQRMVKEKRV